MNFTLRTASIAFSLVVAGLFIAAAYLFSGPNPLGFSAANAGVTDDLLKAYTVKDSDSDGLPDWEEALYGTNPNDAHTVNASLTDKEAVDQGLVKPKYAATPAADTGAPAAQAEGPTPATNTLTSQFAEFLFTQYFNNRGAVPMTKDQISTFVKNTVPKFFAAHAFVPAYVAANVRIAPPGTETLESYAARIEQALSSQHIATSKGEIEYFSDAVRKNDAAALKKVKDIGAAYTALGKLFISVSPPQEAAAAHLEIANAFDQLGAIITDISTIQDDPVRAMYGLNAYEASAIALAQGLSDMGNVYAAQNVTVAQGQPGYNFYSITKEIADSKKAP